MLNGDKPVSPILLIYKLLIVKSLPSKVPVKVPMGTKPALVAVAGSPPVGR